LADWTYTTLLATIAATLNKTNLTAVIPDFVSLGEAVMFRRLKVRRQQQTMDFDLEDESAGVPSDMREVLSLTITDPVSRVEYVTPDAFDDLDLGTGEPRFYTIVGTQLLFAPTPDRSYPMRLRYRQGFCKLTAASRTNWLLCEHPDAYLYAALCESAPYLRDDERLPMWQARRDQIIAEINGLDPRPTTRLRMDGMASLSRAHGYDITRG
jgi:hypothetical protein